MKTKSKNPHYLVPELGVNGIIIHGDMFDKNNHLIIENIIQEAIVIYKDKNLLGKVYVLDADGTFPRKRNTGAIVPNINQTVDLRRKEYLSFVEGFRDGLLILVNVEKIFTNKIELTAHLITSKSKNVEWVLISSTFNRLPDKLIENTTKIFSLKSFEKPNPRKQKLLGNEFH